MTRSRRGIVYACSHRDWMPETIRSAMSFARHMPDIERHFFVTAPLHEECRHDLGDAFTKVFILEGLEHEHRPRFESMRRTDLDEAIFIDGDTLLLAPVYELFDVLIRFDLGAAIAPQLFHPDAAAKGIYDIQPKLSMAIPEWNTGLLVVKKSDRFLDFVEKWNDLFIECAKLGIKMDQPAFRSAIAGSDLQIATLANIYNIRANVEQVIRGNVRILHAHGDLPAIARTINSTPALRHYLPDMSFIEGYRPPRRA
jgi:hypothetical protein